MIGEVGWGFRRLRPDRVDCLGMLRFQGGGALLAARLGLGVHRMIFAVLRVAWSLEVLACRTHTDIQKQVAGPVEVLVGYLDGSAVKPLRIASSVCVVVPDTVRARDQT